MKKNIYVIVNNELFSEKELKNHKIRMLEIF